MISQSDQLITSRHAQDTSAANKGFDSKTLVKSNNLARVRWIKCLNMVRQIVKGSFPGCLTLRDTYFKEFFDPDKVHMIHHTKLKTEWMSSNSSLSYFKWLSQKKDRPTGIVNVSPQNKSHYCVCIENNKIIFHKNFNQEWLTEIDNNLLDTPLVFIVDKHNHIYVGIKKPTIFQHASLSNWRPIKNAGILYINRDHRLLAISNLSGHYVPKPEKITDFLKTLSEKNNLEKIDLRVWITFADNLEPTLPFEGQASYWLDYSEKV